MQHALQCTHSSPVCLNGIFITSMCQLACILLASCRQVQEKKKLVELCACSLHFHHLSLGVSSLVCTVPAMRKAATAKPQGTKMH